MRIWSILLIQSDLKWCIHLSRSLYLYSLYVVCLVSEHGVYSKCVRIDSNPQPWVKSDALPIELTGLSCRLYYLNDLYVYMYFLYKCIHWYKFENDEVDRILSCKCSVLCYILEYSYIVQIAKRRTSPVLSTCKTRSSILSDLVFACWKQTQDVCVPLLLYNIAIFQCVLFVQYSYIPMCITKRYIYKTKYDPLHHSRTYTSVYIGITLNFFFSYRVKWLFCRTIIKLSMCIYRHKVRRIRCLWVTCPACSTSWLAGWSSPW